MAGTGARAKNREIETATTVNLQGRDIGINEISPTEWRVSDRMIADSDASALLGFIQRVDDAFEVTNLGRPRERSYFSSFDRATASLAVCQAPARAVLR